MKFIGLEKPDPDEPWTIHIRLKPDLEKPRERDDEQRRSHHDGRTVMASPRRYPDDDPISPRASW